jgi:plasmid maintenance system killer protein
LIAPANRGSGYLAPPAARHARQVRRAETGVTIPPKVSGNWRMTFTFADKDADDVDYEDYH